MSATASGSTITVQAGGATTIGDSGETDDVTAHGNVSITTIQQNILGTSGALTTNGDITSSNGNVVLDSAAGLDTNQPVSATASSATIIINGPSNLVSQLPQEDSIDNYRRSNHDRQYDHFQRKPRAYAALYSTIH